jgi:hypothetical protein
MEISEDRFIHFLESADAVAPCLDGSEWTRAPPPTHENFLMKARAVLTQSKLLFPHVFLFERAGDDLVLVIDAPKNPPLSQKADLTVLWRPKNRHKITNL